MSLKHVAIALGCGMLHHASNVRADPAQEAAPRRELAGHVFFPSLIVNDPFVSTYVAMSTAAGYSWIDGPGFDSLGSLTGSGSYRAQAMAQALTVQANVIDFMALRFTGGGGLDGGGNARSALVVGMVQPLTAGAGATLGWDVGKVARLGVTADFVYSHIDQIQPLVAIQDSLVSGDVQLSSASERLNRYSVLPGVAFAIAPCPSAGVLASVQYSWSSQSDGVTRHFQTVALGASAQLDLRPAYEMPIGFLASYRATIPFESEVRFTNTVEGGVFYTGRKELDLGVDTQLKWFDLRPDHVIRLDTTELIGVAEIRYHWN